MCLINITCDFSRLDFSDVSRSVNTITINQSTHACYSLFQKCPCISLVIGRFKTTAWRESIYFKHFICHFKNMTTVSTIRRHPRGLKTNFVGQRPDMVYLPSRGNFVDHDFLEASCLASFLQHVSPLAMEALPSNSPLHMLPIQRHKFNIEGTEVRIHVNICRCSIKSYFI